VHYSTIDELNEKLAQALQKSLERDNKIPTGIFYKNELITPNTKRITDKIPNYLENPAAKQKISKKGKPTTDISEILDSLNVLYFIIIKIPYELLARNSNCYVIFEHNRR